MVDLAGLDELLDGAGDVLDRDVRVDAVLVEQVDGVGPQATQGALDGGADVVGPAGDAGLLAVLVEREPELGGDDDILADRLQCLTHQLLVVEGAIDLRGVEHGDATVHRGTEEGDHLVSGWSWTERLAHAHAAEAEGGHLKALRAECASLHCASPSSRDRCQTCPVRANVAVTVRRRRRHSHHRA